MAEIELVNLHKMYGDTQAVRGINLSVADNEMIVLVGPSGCGKSTTLRMIAGLESISDGNILIDGTVVNELPAKQRDIAMVFQNYALYPHMTVYQNMAFALKMRRVPKAEIRGRVLKAAEILDIGELIDRRPRQLSGGQRQRVAMGRAIVRDPKVFLFDEPLSNLDAKLRVQMRNEIKRLHERLQTTMCYVTHDQVEAMTLADRIVVMNHGIIEQIGTPQDLYDRPNTIFVAGFIGSPAMNFIDTVVENAKGEPMLRVSSTHSFRPPDKLAQQLANQAGRKLILGLRPEHITEQRPHSRPEQQDFDCVIEMLEPMGMDTVAHFRLGSAEVCARVAPRSVSEPGSPMQLSADLFHMNLFDPETGKALDESS
jgi:multiple sugar transport system ATP-binding protein